MKKSGYFFTLDAFIAIGVITAGLVLVLVTSGQRPFQEQAVFFADDLLNSMAQQTVQETNDPYLQQLRKDGTVTNLGNTLFEQLGELYVRRQNDIARELAESLTQGRVQQQYGYAIRVNKTDLYATGAVPATTPVLVTSQAIISGVANTTTFWGPLEAEVRVWQE